MYRVHSGSLLHAPDPPTSQSQSHIHTFSAFYLLINKTITHYKAGNPLHKAIHTVLDYLNVIHHNYLPDFISCTIVGTIM